MSILDLTDKPAWYAVRVTAQRCGPKGYLGVQYRWAQPKYLSNMDALGYAFELQPRTTTKAGVQTFLQIGTVSVGRNTLDEGPAGMKARAN